MISSGPLPGKALAARSKVYRALLASLVLWACASPAPAAARPGELAETQRQARAAAAEVSAIRAQLLTAQREYRLAVARVGLLITDSVAAQTRSLDAETASRRAVDQTGASARALYHSGGPGGLWETVLTSGNVDDLTIRLLGVGRVLRSADEQASAAQAASASAAQAASALAERADQSVVTAETVAAKAARVDDLFARAQRRLAELSAQAQRVQAAQFAAQALARARAAAAAEQRLASASVRAQAAPGDYFALYQAAALTCPGMDWTLLAAVGQVESGHGRNVGPSSAGAVGPMQFMPRTFAAYGVDGNRDGVKDAW
ncbi:MAG: lytic murein transglycosylase, partial [Angustibacter sp.]